MPQTVVEKVAERHMVDGPTGRPLRAGDFLTLRPRHVLTHDNTAPVMSKFAAIGSRIHDPRQPVFALDHDIQNDSDENLAKYRAIEEFADEQGVDFHPAGTGIGHQVMVERLYVVPGALVVASDSHANMYGAVGAVGTPVVRTDAAAIWAAGTFWWQVPRSVEVVLEDSLPTGSTGKDVILALCGLYREGEVLNAAVEFTGEGVATLSMDERLSIANMTTEWGALVGWFPADETTLAFLESRGAASDDLHAWRTDPLRPEPDAPYAARIRLSLADVAPHVAGPDSVQVTTPLAEIERERIPIRRAYLVSCVNSRREDLAAAAEVLRGERVARGVDLYVAAASREILQAAEADGDWQALLDAGAHPLPPGCGPCIGLGTGLLEPGEVGISATNRNFKGRMGSRDAKCYLASPSVVAASARAGHICGPAPAAERRLEPHYEVLAEPPAASEAVEILPGFPERVEGRLVYLTADNLNTDGIYGKDWTYRDDVTPETMARVVFENYDPGLASRLEPGDVIVGGRNFGTGSSREQAATAIRAAGVPVVIAATYSQTYLRNAFNNGFPCIACPALVTRLREWFAEEAAPAVVTRDRISIDFAEAALTVRGETFAFPPLGAAPQALVVAGGVENQVRRRLATP